MIESKAPKGQKRQSDNPPIDSVFLFDIIRLVITIDIRRG